MVCPECGSPMVLRSTVKFKHKDGQARKFWGCSQWPECSGVHGAHPDGTPLGIPADKETKELRIKAHAALDGLRQAIRLSRADAYKLLQQIMGMSEDEAHIGRFSKEQCMEAVGKLLAEKFK